MSEKISVIVPVYNVESYLEKCVHSICSQTYENLEIILVDDGSPDNCGKMCDEWAKKDCRIKVIHKENGGLSDARNAGLDIVTGDYFVFVDSDDFVHKDYIKIRFSTLTFRVLITIVAIYWKKSTLFIKIFKFLIFYLKFMPFLPKSYPKNC